MSLVALSAYLLLTVGFISFGQQACHGGGMVHRRSKNETYNSDCNCHGSHVCGVCIEIKVPVVRCMAGRVQDRYLNDREATELSDRCRDDVVDGLQSSIHYR